MKNNRYNNYQTMLKGTGMVILVLLVFVLGAFVGTRPSVSKLLTPNKTAHAALTAEGKDMSEFWYVWNLMQEKYPFVEKTPTDTERIHGAIAGMVSAYKDPYTVFFPPTQAKLFGDQVKGSFGGVGMEVGIKNNFITVVAPMKDSPAEKAGIKAGDIIAEINGKPTDDMNIDTAISLIRGDVGTKVDLALARVGATELKRFSIVRDIVKIPVLETSTKGDVFIISFYSFTEDSAELFTQALESFIASGKTKLIIDLRNNPGGYLDSAVNIASYFLPRGATVVKENAGNKESEIIHQSKGYTLLDKLPKTVILINGGSASASEILAGALSDFDKATLVGTQSFGKGSVQQVLPLDDGSALKITIAKWFTPNGVSISEKGITPDVKVTTEPVLDKKTNTYNDPVLEQALKILNQ